MQKILYVITKSNWGGAQRYVFDLAAALPKQEWQVSVVMGGSGEAGAPGGRLEQELRHRDIRTIFIPSFMRDVSLSREWRVLRDLMDLFAREQPDIVHLNSSKAGGLGALSARLAGVPHIVFTAHGLPWDEDRSAAAKACIKFFSWMTFMLCHTIIVISREAQARVSTLPFCAGKVRLVHNGIAPLRFSDRASARAALGIDTNMPVIGAVGELTWNKGYHSLLRAAEILKRRGKDFYICIVGGGGEQKFIETMIEEESLRGYIRLTGFLPDAHQHLKAFDIYTLPSVKEGLPYVLMEAGQAGLPVVASGVGGVGDIIEDGQTGLLCAPKDAGDLADKIESMLDSMSLRERLGAALREKVTKEFSIERMVESTIAVYKR